MPQPNAQGSIPKPPISSYQPPSHSYTTTLNMVKFFPSISPDHAEFMLAQPLFYVASAPLVRSHVNLSPKGQPSRSFAVLGPNTVAYVDATGSGCETIAHVYENGRVTVMFCSF